MLILRWAKLDKQTDRKTNGRTGDPNQMPRRNFQADA